MKKIMGVQVDNRFEEVDRMQKVFTEFGCIIKTRIGLHQQAEFNEECTEKGLILLELNDNSNDRSVDLENKLQQIEGLTVKCMEFQ
ncbi:hypothetical protein [Thermohalobacter berrensis]|uniref:Iron-only hydrogenase system regulator n=1 Tax=Thermohalobacter berrensis TaxID=99594 RepID=A0A419SV57_9FIRM|nr:hypothetical protein [Thermohalobacter berrensis]RKD29118.1 hypothetical protein BET03_06110 [Thermohalobacter berrensis]